MSVVSELKRFDVDSKCTYYIQNTMYMYLNKPKRKTLSVSGVEYNHNFNQPLPEIIGERFDLNDLNIEGYKAGDCTCKSPKLEWNHFIRVQKFNETRHPKTNVLCVTVLAWTENNYKAPVLLICKYTSHDTERKSRRNSV